MNNTHKELDIIARMRGEVMGRKEPTGENLFLVWGYPTCSCTSIGTYGFG